MVTDEHTGMVMMKTRVGGTHVVDMLSGEQFPRICWKLFNRKFVCAHSMPCRRCPLARGWVPLNH
jgi:hypothetical protein